MADKSITERTLAIIKLINNHPEGLTITEIQNELQNMGDHIGYRQIARYPGILRDLGVQLEEHLDGRNRKYRIKNYFTQKPQLTDQEGVELYLTLMGSGGFDPKKQEKILSSLISKSLQEKLTQFFVFNDGVQLTKTELTALEKIFQKWVSRSSIHIKQNQKNFFFEPMKIIASKNGVIVFMNSKENQKYHLKEVMETL